MVNCSSNSGSPYSLSHKLKAPISGTRNFMMASGVVVHCCACAVLAHKSKAVNRVITLISKQCMIDAIKSLCHIMLMSDPFKLLIISDAWHPQVNGVVRTYEHLGEELEKKGHTVKVIGPADFKFRLPTPGYQEIELALFPYGRLQKMIEAYAPDRIHISTEGPIGWAGRRYCLKHNRPFSTSYHTQFPDYVAKRVGKIFPFLYDWTHERAKNLVRRFHAPSKSMMVATDSLEETLKAWGFKNPMHRLTRGAKLDIFYPAKDESDKTEFKDLKAPVALYVGRIAVEKNIEAFLDMEWAGAKVIVGDGPAREELEAQYPDAHFIGSRTGTALAACYRSADLFVFPSRTDTFGMVIVEALASGLPVAAYNVTGPKDIIVKDFLGALDEDDLARAAQKAMNCGEPEQRAQHVREHHTWENAAKQYEDGLRYKVK